MPGIGICKTVDIITRSRHTRFRYPRGHGAPALPVGRATRRSVRGRPLCPPAQSRRQPQRRRWRRQLRGALAQLRPRSQRCRSFPSVYGGSSTYGALTAEGCGSGGGVPVQRAVASRSAEAPIEKGRLRWDRPREGSCPTPLTSRQRFYFATIAHELRLAARARRPGRFLGGLRVCLHEIQGTPR
jgi:hypothetical protein